jgi:hypothetical protein
VDPLSAEHWYHLERGAFISVKVENRRERESRRERREGEWKEREVKKQGKPCLIYEC